MNPLTQKHISDVWTNGTHEVSPEERRGMTKMAVALMTACKDSSVVFQCPDGTLLKISRYHEWFSPEHASEMMNDKFVINAINLAYNNGRDAAIARGALIQTQV